MYLNPEEQALPRPLGYGDLAAASQPQREANHPYAGPYHVFSSAALIGKKKRRTPRGDPASRNAPDPLAAAAKTGPAKASKAPAATNVLQSALPVPAANTSIEESMAEFLREGKLSLTSEPSGAQSRHTYWQAQARGSPPHG